MLGTMVVRRVAIAFAVASISACTSQSVNETQAKDGSAGADASGSGGAAGMPGSAYRNAVLADNPVAYFRLGDANDATAKNEIGTGPTGVYINVSTDPNGAIANDPDTAAKFDPTQSGVEIDQMPSFDTHLPFTLEAWIKPIFDGSYHTVMAKLDNAADGYFGYTIYFKDGELSVDRVAGNSVGGDFLSYAGLEELVYTHVAAVYDGDTLRIFMSGAAKATTSNPTVSLPATTSKFMIGASAGSPSFEPNNGSIDEVAVYDRALEPARIGFHYKVGVGEL